MRKGHEITQFMPKEINEWKGSPTIRMMTDYQRSWFDELLMDGWANVEMPCHLPNDENRLWKLAGAHSRVFFGQHSAVVVRQFRECGDGQWICNGKSLHLYLRKLIRWYKSQPESRRKQEYNAQLEFLSSCTCISSKEKAEFGIIELLTPNFSSEDVIQRIRAIGKWRDGSSITAEHALVEVLANGADPTEVIAQLARIYVWTKSAVYAPRLAEVIRRWEEPQQLWERASKQNDKPAGKYDRIFAELQPPTS